MRRGSVVVTTPHRSARRGDALLRQLERDAPVFGPGRAPLKRSALDRLETLRLSSPGAVRRLHELLCFLRAYPDDAAVLHRVERLLGAFHRRADLRRFRNRLADSGIAGTEIRYRFFWFTAVWLARRWPDHLHVDWPELGRGSGLEPLLRLLVPYSESAAMEDVTLSPRQWVERLRGPHVTDATFLVRRFEALHADGFLREMLYERLDPPLRLTPGAGTPSRTQARYTALPVVYRTRPLDRSRPDLRQAVRLRPLAVRAVLRREASRIIDLARESMVTRSRDLDSFEHANPDDVRLVDCGDGLQFACIGLVPERRALLDSIYGYLTFQSGVPIGYVLSSALFGSALVAYNVFETFRGAESARNYGKVLAMLRSVFGCDTFAVDPYQLGHHNAEGLTSGAWWFYYKLGFRPTDPGVRRRVRAEVARLRAHPGARSSRATLQQLSSAHVFLHLGRPRSDVLGRLQLGNVSLHVADFLSRRFGAEREAGLRTCAEEASHILGGRSRATFSRGERLAWERWSPLVLLLPGIERWSSTEKQHLVRAICAKGDRSEAAFVPLFDSHRKLRRAILTLSRRPASGLRSRRRDP